jgi:hypothetical protein
MESLIIGACIVAFVALCGGLRYARYRNEKVGKELDQEYLSRMDEVQNDLRASQTSTDRRITSSARVASSFLNHARTAMEFRNYSRGSLHLRCAEVVATWTKALTADMENDPDGSLTNGLLEAVYHIWADRPQLARQSMSVFGNDQDPPFAELQADHHIEVLCLFLEKRYDEMYELSDSGPTIVMEIGRD